MKLLKEAMEAFVAIEAVDPEEDKARAALEARMRELPRSWQYMAGIGQGAHILASINPKAERDIVFTAAMRLILWVSAKLTLEYLKEEDDSFPEEL